MSDDKDKTGLSPEGDIMWLYWRNKKKGHLYEVKEEAIAATNSREGEIDVVYTRNGQSYTREKSEFLEKFEPWHDK